MAKIPSSSKLYVVVMLLSFLALSIITHARTFSPDGKFFQDSPAQSYEGPSYAPVPPSCFNPPGCGQTDKRRKRFRHESFNLAT
ncbi:unnamed protein product [Eruca vesicaria subsp. sativa]|uniref:Transmembrane protein n=1 Tax=Eruca vesicaria subsp. sativa TaxID=29727 RepID=A0ABC8KFJ3_ERUVS|nr:unnamed protein product [Eruca vesicaria subsp. sativa]